MWNSLRYELSKYSTNNKWYRESILLETFCNITYYVLSFIFTLIFNIVLDNLIISTSGFIGKSLYVVLSVFILII